MRAVYVRYFECKYTQDNLITQEIMQEKSPIKQRILQFIEYEGITQYEVYKNTGITRGILTQNNGISEENLSRFLEYYHEISINWLLTGEGSMLIGEKIHRDTDNISAADPEPANYHNSTPGEMITRHDADLEALRSKIEMLERIIESKDETISALQERIDSQRHFLDMLSAAHRDIVDRSEKMLEENNRLLNTNNNILNNIASPEYVQQLIVALSISKKGEPDTELSAGTGKYSESTEEM